MVYFSDSANQTKLYGEQFAKTLKSGDIVLLKGEMGAGKTVFVKGICNYFRVKDYVVSPSYTLLNVYEGELPIYHFDIYRIETEDDLFNIGYYEYEKNNGIVIVEWAEILPEVFDKPGIVHVDIERDGESGRKIILRGESQC